MQLINITKNKILSKDLKEAKSLIDQLFGLLNKRNPRSLIFKTRFGIHTFFLKEDIDVIVLDKNMIVKKIATLSPNSLFFWNIKYTIVIELPRGTVKKTYITRGNKLKLI